MKKLIFEKGLAYFGVILIGYCVDILVFTYVLSISGGLAVANMCGFLIGACINAVVIRNFVFKDTRFSLSVDLIANLTIAGVIFACGTFILTFSVENLGFNPFVAKLLTNAFTFLANFLIRATFFRNSSCSLTCLK